MNVLHIKINENHQKTKFSMILMKFDTRPRTNSEETGGETRSSSPPLAKSVDFYPRIRGTRGGLPARHSQPVDPAGSADNLKAEASCPTPKI